MKVVRSTVPRSGSRGHYWGERLRMPVPVVGIAAIAANMFACAHSRDFDVTLSGSTQTREAGIVSHRQQDANLADAAVGGGSIDRDGEPSTSSTDDAGWSTDDGWRTTDAGSDTEGCARGTFACDGDRRTMCKPDGTWQSVPESEQCAGSLPVCSGNGVCAAFRSRGNISGLATFESGSPAPFVVREEGFLTSARICSQVYCVSGGLIP